MAIGLPNIDVIFQGKANSAVTRSEKGVACLVITDDTQETKTITYKGFSEVDDGDYTSENLKVIEDVFMSDISKLIVLRMGSDETFANVKHLVTKDVNWIAIISNTPSEQKAVADFVKLENKTRVRRLKQVGHNITTAPDDMHVVNFVNTTVTKIGDEPIQGHLFLGRLLGVLAGCRLDQSVTYFKFQELESVAEVSDVETNIGKGQFILINDEDSVRVARAVNSLTTNDKEHTEDMKFITIVEGMDLMYEDIVRTFKDTYIGKFKNSYDNQVLFMSAVNSYFRSLAKDEVLDPNYENTVMVDIEKQREMWISNGTTEAEAWDEKKVKNMTFRTNVYLTAKVKFLNAIEDLDFIVNM